ncbi:hypothetical protein ABW19_dt0203716 [Dactylella cylindrospora]|nr:hypothetical protein ABW19_dt0203716 [Dactylella cylindrospora]
MDISSLLVEYQSTGASESSQPDALPKNSSDSHNTTYPTGISRGYQQQLGELERASMACRLVFPDACDFGSGSKAAPVIIDSESEEEDSDYALEELAAPGSSSSPISISSNFSSREPSIFDTPPQSATSTATTDSLIPEATKQVIDLTIEHPTSKGKQKAVEPEIIDVDAIPSTDPQFFDDDIEMIQQDSDECLNRSDMPDVEMTDFSNTPDLQQYLQLMMSTLEANRLLRAAAWKPVEQDSSISKLPPELLWMIFDYALPSLSRSTIDDPAFFQERLKEGIPMMKVCRQWRYMLLPKILRSVTVSECTFLTKSAHCQFCQIHRYLVSVPVVRSLFDGTATIEMMQMAEHIRTVALSPLPCERRSKNGEDSLESGFVYFLPRVETVVLPSSLVRNFLNGSSAHGLNLNPKALPNIRVYNPTPAAPTRRRLPFSDFHDVGDVGGSWIIPEDVKKLELDGDCLRLCAKIPMLLLEELTIDRRSHGDKFAQTPPASALCQFLSLYSTEFSTLSRITLRWLPKPDPSFPLSSGSNSTQDPCLCSLLASIPSLEHLDLSSICPLLFAKKVGKCISSVAFEYPCVLNRTRPPPPTKYTNIRSLIGPATEMRTRLIPEGVESSRVPTVITLISIKSRDMPHLVEASLTTPPSYSLDLAKKITRVTEYSAKAATRYKLYINSLVTRSTKTILAREPKGLLSEYAIAAHAKSLTDTWHCSYIGPPASKKQRTTVLKWNYDVDLDVFLSGASSGEFMTLGRQKDRILNAREAEERKMRKLEMEKIKSAAPPKKRSRKRKADTQDMPIQVLGVTPGKKQKQKQGSAVVLPPVATVSPAATPTAGGSTIHPGMIQILWA